MALYTLNMENLATLDTDDKAVQVTDMVNVHGDILGELLTRITDLEAEVARLGAVIEDDNKTQAFDPDLANMADVADVPDEVAPKTPKKPETPKKKSPKKKSPKKKSPKKEKVDKPSCEELALLGFDPTKCRRRIYNQGWGCQCQKNVFESRLCKADYNALYGDKKKETKSASPEKDTFAHGYADEPRPDTNPITGDAHRWRDADGEFPAKKKGKKASPKTDSPKKEKGEKMKSPSVPELRDAILALAPEKDLKGMKKKELVGLLEYLQKPQEVPEVEEGVPEAVPQLEEAVPQVEEAVPQVEEAVPQVEEAVPQVEEAVPQVEEAVPQVPADLEEETGDELDEYLDVEFQGVDYLAKGDKLFNCDFELIGTWDGMVATFTTDEAKDKHLAEKDTDDEDNDA
jgi:hypothetical protein